MRSAKLKATTRHVDILFIASFYSSVTSDPFLLKSQTIVILGYLKDVAVAPPVHEKAGTEPNSISSRPSDKTKFRQYYC